MLIQESTLLKIIRGGIYAILFLPFIVIPQLFFPFSVSKGFLFQIIIEVLFALYLVLVFKNPNYLPKKSLLVILLSVYFGVLLLSTLLGLDVYRSFFGNYERMWGYFQLLHFFLFFVLLAGVFKTAASWRKLVRIALFSGGLTVAFGLFQFLGSVVYSDVVPRITSTIGNAAFLAGMPFVRIIHGKGTGKLRKAIRQALKSNEYVASFEPGHQNEGGDGVTMVKLSTS